MSDITDAIEAYRLAVADVPMVKADGVEERVLAALLARDRIALELARGAPPTPDLLIATADADRQLNAKAPAINEAVGAARLAEWRRARRPAAPQAAAPTQDENWWWSLDAHAPRDDGWRARAVTFLLWGVVIISLSFIVESVRRFVSGEVGVLGTVLQGVVTLLVGSSLVQFAGQLVAARAARPAGEQAAPPPLKRRLIFPATFVAIALTMWFLLPWVVGIYSDRGVEGRHEGQLSKPFSHYLRGISLEPSDAVAHYNLARAYEAIGEFDKAETEYKTTIRWDDKEPAAYDGLARLLIASKKDYANALRLLNTGLDKLEAQKAEFPNEDHYKRIRVSLLKHRAWAYFRLKYFTQARDDLLEAAELRPNAASHCLLGQVLEEEQKLLDGEQKSKMAQQSKTAQPRFGGEILQAYNKCVALSAGQQEKIEPDWMAHAQEWLNRKDEQEARDASDDQKPERQK
jgi:tetratricopeptide (TPR) repeat protein